MSDVGAVVLTLGEPTTGRALRSLRAQSVPIEQIVVVDGVRPFHRALNEGAERVTTPFFLQVDADMVLDPRCAEVLRDTMSEGVGIATGALRDPLMGTISGVKMFRRECFDLLKLQDTVAPEVDFYLTLAQLGWTTRYVIAHRRMRALTLGDHRPAFHDVDYVFGTYYVLGRTHAYRDDPIGLRWRYRQLRRSRHPMTPVARVSLAHGTFGGETRDGGKPRPSAADSTFLRALAARAEETDGLAGRIRSLLALPTQELGAAFSELGRSLRASSPARLRACLRLLAEADHPSSVPAEVALGHGALAGR